MWVRRRLSGWDLKEVGAVCSSLCGRGVGVDDHNMSMPHSSTMQLIRHYQNRFIIQTLPVMKTQGDACIKFKKFSVRVVH